MKKSILVALLGLISLSACQEEEDVVTNKDDTVIDFNTYTTKSTRAPVMDNTQLKTSGFLVSAYSTGASDIGSTAVPNLMDSTKVSWSAVDNVWTYSPVQYWPGMVNDVYGKVSFYAWSPGDAGYVPSENGIPTLTVSVYDHPYAMNDLVVSKQENRNLPWFTANGNKVDFTFQHVFSKIGFAARKTADATRTIVITDCVYSFEDTGTIPIYSRGVYSFETNSWSNLNNRHGFEAVPNLSLMGTDEDLTLTTNAQQVNIPDKYLFFIPQQLSANAMFVHISYTINGQAYERTLSLPATTWAMGKQYTYNFTISDASIIFDSMNVGDWVD